MRPLGLLIAAILAWASQASAQEYVPGEVIVKLRVPGNSEEAFAFMGKAHAQKEMILKGNYGKMRMYHFGLRKGQRVEDAIAELKQDPNVEYAEPNYILRKSAEVGVIQKYSFEEMQNIAQSNTTWATGGVDIGLETFHQSKAVTSQAVSGSGKQVVAVIDTGLDLDHSVFKNTNSIWKNPGETCSTCRAGVDDDGNGYVDDINGWNFVDNSALMYDDDGHGTHVSGIVLSVDQDILASPLQESRIAIMPLKFLDGSGVGSTSNAIKAIYYAVQNGAVVLNNSWGGPNYSGSLHEAVTHAYNHGVSFVAAAGNAGGNNDSAPMYPASYDVPNVIAVAATTSSNSLAYFSNYGRNSVHLGSPGVMIYSTLPGGWGSASGTSMATPFVAGVAIQMAVESPNMMGYQVKQIIFGQADKASALVGKVYTEARLDAFNSIAYAQSATVETSQPAYAGAYASNRELASTLSGGGCGLVSKMVMDAKGINGGQPPQGPRLQGPSTWYVLLVLALFALPVAVAQWLRSRAPENRRRHERFKINSEVSVHVGGRELVGSISTISMGGVQLNTDALLENGGIVKMSISSPDGKDQIEVEGRVVWSEANKAYGVAFSNAPRGVLSRIGDWTKALQKAA